MVTVNPRVGLTLQLQAVCLTSVMSQIMWLLLFGMVSEGATQHQHKSWRNGVKVVHPILAAYVDIRSKDST